MVDWSAVFVPQNSLLEVILRGSLIYILLFSVLRFFMNRQAGAVGIPDILVVVLVVESTTDALGRNESVTEAAVLILTVMLWSYGLQWLAYRVPALAFIVTSPPVALIRDGKLQRRNMRRELVTEDELMSLLRSQGVDDPGKVKLACLEGTGDISVVTDEASSGPGGQSKTERFT